MSEIKKILDQRQEEYGDPETNFERIGIIWSVILNGKEPIPSWKVALMMDAVKTVRLIRNPNHKDSWNDKLGYTEIGIKIVDDSRIIRCNQCGSQHMDYFKCETCRIISERTAERRDNENLKKAGKTMIIKGNGEIGIR